MKKMKLFLAAALICGAAFAGYTAYERATMTEQEKALLANLEALTDGESEFLDDCDPKSDKTCLLIVVEENRTYTIEREGYTKKDGWI